MSERYKQLKPYLHTVQSSGNDSFDVHFVAPASLLMQLGGFYKFELSNEILEDDLIYAHAWYKIPESSYEELIRD